MIRGTSSRSNGFWVRSGRTALLFGLATLIPGVSAFADSGKELWATQSSQASAALVAGSKAAIKPVRSQGLTLNRDGMAALLAGAPLERTAAGRQGPLVVALPDPKGGFQRFELVESPVMEPGLAKKHPDIKTYAGRGLDDPTARVRADLTPLGFHAAVRSAGGSWYIDPYQPLDQSLYLSYFRRDVKENPHGPFSDVIAGSDGLAEISVTRGFYHAADDVTLHGSGFAPNAQVTLTIADPNGAFAERTLAATADEEGALQVEFTADPDGALGPHHVAADDGKGPAFTLYDVVSDEDASHDPPTGDQLRTYRLALVTDPGYATYFGGPTNVTAAKVSLMNRVNELYEGDLSIRMVLVAANDSLNLDTWDLAIAPNGPCGAAGCFTLSQVTSCSSLTRIRTVVGQIIGASNYDIGHLALGAPGGGVANLGVVGRSQKAQGCTGIPTPVGDFYAVDYVAHEMGHQFSGNHPFNGTQSNCSGGNRNGATAVEPGSGSSIMAYAGICTTDDLSAHSDPYFSQRSLQEITTYTTSSPAAINEVQTVSLRHFGGGNEIQVVTFGPGFSTTTSSFQISIGGNNSAVVGSGGLAYGNVNLATAINGIAGFAGTATVTSATALGFTVTYTGASAGIDVPSVSIVNLSCNSCFSSVQETNHGGASDHFTIQYGGVDSGLIANGLGGNYTAAGIKAAIEAIAPAGTTVTVLGFGGAAFGSNTGFQVTFGGTAAGTDVSALSITNASAGVSGFVGETDKGGAVTNQGYTVTATGNAYPVVAAPTNVTIPLRTPFYLTGSATDADGDALVYSWEQNDRGGATGTGLVNNTKTNGPLFAMFPKSALVSATDTLLYHSPGENSLTTNPTRVFPDLQQILDNNTNADTGACPVAGPNPVAFPIRECFAEFLPTSAYLGFAGVNASPLALHFRLTARDGKGGVNAAPDTTVLLATNAGPFRVTSPDTAVSWRGGTTQTVTWDVANTDAVPTSVANVTIRLSVDGGLTYPITLASDTPNDGSETVTAPQVSTLKARVMVDATANGFFDVSNAGFQVVPDFVTVTAPDVSGLSWQAGTVKAIKFIHNMGKNAPMKIELNRLYPIGDWETIVASTPTTGATTSTYNWIVSAPVTLGATARIRVTSLATAGATDTGNASFAITSRVKVTAPNSAVKWKVGTTQSIKFTHNYLTPHAFTIAIDRDGDGVCEQTLKTPLVATTSAVTWPWVVTGPTGATNHICVTSNSDPAGTDISNALFTIQ